MVQSDTVDFYQYFKGCAEYKNKSYWASNRLAVMDVPFNTREVDKNIPRSIFGTDC